jgi:hypothetical protein
LRRARTIRDGVKAKVRCSAIGFKLQTRDCLISVKWNFPLSMFNCGGKKDDGAPYPHAGK